jgi:hypothetical protein
MIVKNDDLIDFFTDLKHLIKNERIHLIINRISKNEYKFENPDKSIIIKILIDYIYHILFYDVYFLYYKKHFKENSIYNFDEIYSLNKTGNLDYLKYLPDIWFNLDRMKHWSENNSFSFKGKELT